MDHRRSLGLAVMFLALLLACGQVARLPAETPTRTEPSAGAGAETPAPASATLPQQSAQPAIPFVTAVEYAVPGLAEVFAETGVTHAKPQPIWSLWGTIEPERGEYDWKPLDALVLEYQQYGYTGLQLLLTAESPWAATRPPSLGDKGDPFPQERFLDDYAAFVRNVVERYDSDGLNDMPGLRYPILQYGIEREFTGYWPTGDAEQYVRLLRIAYREVKAADPNAQVLLIALLLSDIFHDDPSPDIVESRLSQASTLSFSAEKIRTLLAACDVYDIVDFHSLADYVEIPPTAAWIRAELESNGCGERPIWIGDAFSMSGLIGYADPWGLVPMKTFAPASGATAEGVLELLQAVAEPQADNHLQAVSWLRAEMAHGLVRKIVVSAGEGLAGINVGNMEDWTLPIGTELNAALARSLGTSLFMGMVDRELTGRTAGGPLRATGGDLMARVRQVEDRRPAFYALQLVLSMLKGFSDVDRLEADDGVWAYRFETPHGLVWVLWHDDRALNLPGESKPTATTQLPFDAPHALLTRTPTVQGETGPETDLLEVVAGSLRLTLDATPVFIQPAD